MSKSLDEGKIAPSRAANHSGGPEAAREWLQNYAAVIPADIRPSQAELPEFAAFISTFLISSFDIVAKPGKRAADYLNTWCNCPYCLRMVNAPYLQPKKPTAGDKRRAEILMADCLIELGRANGIELDVGAADRFVAERRYRRSCAYLTYGESLIRRLRGESDGPAVLVLWRQIAWLPSGGMIRGFRLELPDFVAAEELLKRALATREVD
ncbi:hypothetical protein [Anatilimnocola floriformis]|uniref:hypothetical protein n=1 Tax=Anatilimnocola floriformis TaxID=2948575 RepID=UPI0020C49F9D|nr:hypothetical protein [Anatilimnocola floriformis]